MTGKENKRQKVYSIFSKVNETYLLLPYTYGISNTLA